MSAREIHVAGVRLLVSLKKDQLAIAKALIARDVVALHGATEIAWKRPDPRLAATDPALYKALSDGVTAFFLKGYAVLNREKLAAEAAAELLRRRGS
ncbi:MAG: hypothetical protein GY873_27890 [Bosea sp.]|jgi:hypothetical protein|uniref:hypothetical protein n=1 Tax=Bosea sp. (in: a-proteobacteria) TaxID=1871050 RepID=UPI0023905B3A|nr:hypothetical protein [Bosea sp. (in: a-proteobacteria)]MCP4738019.1 hypothetical protein [Bosea sp. (in: a-proteobacteria)]